MSGRKQRGTTPAKLERQLLTGAHGSSLAHRGRCAACGKFSWLTRKAARRAVKLGHAGESMTIYRCPVDPDVFHVGHRAYPVARGFSPRNRPDLEAGGQP